MFLGKVINFIAVVVLIVSTSAKAWADDYLDRLIESMTTRELIGQLLVVDVPADSANYQYNQHFSFFFEELKVGNIMINGYHELYNYESKRGAYLNLQRFINSAQQTAYESINVPMLVCADFESNRYSSIRKSSLAVPSALSLATTQNSTLIELAGKVAANQLMDIGVNLILGPVVDMDATGMGSSKLNIMNRSFGETPLLVYSAISHFINGLRQNGIVVILKHFPGVGHSSGSVHNGVPVFTGGPDTLNKEGEIYEKLHDYVDGVMTSHQTVPFLNSEKEDPVTFSNSVVNGFIRTKGDVVLAEHNLSGLGYGDKLVMSDDLSSMAPVLEYMEHHKMGFSEAAIEAYEAGHDLLLFSHIEVGGLSTRGAGLFRMEELQAVVEKMEQYFTESEAHKNELKKRVKKILKIKCRLAKSFGAWNEGFKPFSSHSESNVDLCVKENSCFSSYEEFINEVFKHSTLLLNKHAEYDLSDLNRSSNITFFVPENAMDVYKSAFASYKGAAFYALPEKDISQEKLDEIKDRLLFSLKRDDKVVLSCSNRSLADAAHYSVIKSRYKKDKLILLVGVTPKILNEDTLLCATVINNFSGHELTTKNFIAILKGELKPKNLHNNLPIGLNSHYKTLQQEFTLSPPKSFKTYNPFETTREKKLNDTIKSLKFKLQLGKMTREELQSELCRIKQECVVAIENATLSSAENKKLKDENNVLGSNLAKVGIEFEKIKFYFFITIIFYSVCFVSYVIVKARLYKRGLSSFKGQEKAETGFSVKYNPVKRLCKYVDFCIYFYKKSVSSVIFTLFAILSALGGWWVYSYYGIVDNDHFLQLSCFVNRLHELWGGAMDLLDKF